MMNPPSPASNNVAHGDNDPSNNVVNISTSPLSSPSPQLTEGEPVQKQLRNQMEFYFSPSNLAKDAFMRSKMNENGFVKLSVIADFPKMRLLLPDGDIQTIVNSIQDSAVCELDDEKKSVRAKFRAVRTTIVLREVPPEVTEQDIVKLFLESNLKPISVRSEVLAMWSVEALSDRNNSKRLILIIRYVTMATENDAKEALVTLQRKFLMVRN